MEEMFDFSARRVVESIEESLTRLGLSYVDIIQVRAFRVTSHAVH